jgi:hypothetical protein
MKMLLFGFGCLLLAACGHDSSPATPTALTQSPAGVVSGNPAVVAATGDPNHFDPAPIRGYESSKWHNLTYKTPKYVFGRALIGIAPTADNLKKVAESQGLLYLGKDLVAFLDGTVVDCIYDFEGPKALWVYQVSH